MICAIIIGTKTMKTIDEDIKNGTWKRIYLLFGEERYLLNLYREKLKKAIPVSDMNSSHFAGKDTDVRKVISLSDTVPFLSEYRLIELDDTQFAKKSCDEFADYIPTIPESTIILMTESEVSSGTKVFKAIEKAGHAAEFNKLDHKTLTTWILSRVKKEHKQITSGAVNLLMERCPDDMYCLDSELDKLFAYTMDRDSISAEDVKAVCSKQTEANVFEMLTAVVSGRRREALDLYYEMLSEKVDPMRILSLLTKQFNELLQVKLLKERRFSEKQIAEKMGFKGKRQYAIGKIAEQGRRFSIQKTRSVLEECIELEEAVKTGRLAEPLSVELLIIKYADKV